MKIKANKLQVILVMLSGLIYIANPVANVFIY